MYRRNKECILTVLPQGQFSSYSGALSSPKLRMNFESQLLSQHGREVFDFHNNWQNLTGNEDNKLFVQHV